MSSNLVYKTEQDYETEKGIKLRIYMDLFEIQSPRNPRNLFLDRYKFSWIAFNIENPSNRILVDCHEPFGIHLHIDNQPRILFDAKTIDDASGFFFEKVDEHFGQIKE